MDISKKQIEMMNGGKLAIACHRDRVGWALYNAMVSKGSCLLSDVDARKIAEIKLERAVVLMPGKSDEAAMANHAYMLALFDELRVPVRLVHARDMVAAALPEGKFYASKTVTGRIKEEMDIISECPDETAALAMATAFYDRGNSNG